MSQANSQGGSKRLLILLGILGIGLVGLGYDRVIARPAVEAAYDSLLAENEKLNASGTDVLNDSSVRDLLGCEPAEMFDDTNGDKVEKYSWRAGMPIKTHDLFVVYKKNDKGLMFHRADKFVFESGGQATVIEADDATTNRNTPGGEDVAMKDGDPELEAEFDMENMPTIMEMSAGGGSGPGGSAPPAEGSAPPAEGSAPPSSEDEALGANTDPGRLLVAKDRDSNGKLEGDELTDELKKILPLADTNKDNALDMDEIYAYTVGGGPPQVQSPAPAETTEESSGEPETNEETESESEESGSGSDSDPS
ncbi:MAG: hypothetical protein AAGG48_14395 [Planctomycetota bacterium]